MKNRPTGRVLDNIQMAVFTSPESAQYIQILLLRCKQMYWIPQNTSDFRGAGV